MPFEKNAENGKAGTFAADRYEGSTMPKSRVRVIIKGIVQGVNFRYYTQREAQKNGVTGWVRNLPDGSVTAVFEGDEEDVEKMVQWCRNGPSSAQVSELIAQPEDYRGEFEAFSVQF